MPPKEQTKKPTSNVVRPPISTSSLFYVPPDAEEGFQERIDQCVDWNTHGSAIRHHRKKCLRENIPTVKFTEALRNKEIKSFLKGFLDKDTALSIQDYWDVILPMIIWDNEKCSTEEAKICFQSNNNITDNLLKYIKKAVRSNDKKLLRKDLKAVCLLRVTNSKMTELDDKLLKYSNLTVLNLSGNFLKKIETGYLPIGLRVLELCTNKLSDLSFIAELPLGLMYLGLSNNILTNDSIAGFIKLLPRKLTTLDLSDNDIYNLDPVVDELVTLPNLTALQLTGNPCTVCTAYARHLLTKMQRLRWLDNRQVLPTDRANPDEAFEPHPDDLRSCYFTFSVLRIMSAPMPPKPEKGATGTFYVELELPLLDSVRRTFLMYRQFDSLQELLPMPEDDDNTISKTDSSVKSSKQTINGVKASESEVLSEESDIFAHLEPKNSRVMYHYTLYESIRVQWAKIMLFQEPTLKIFCPDLIALRNTFRSTITVKFKYCLNYPVRKPDKKSATMFSKIHPGDYIVTLATIRCTLTDVDWSQPFQHFHWDVSLGTNEAIHWGDGDLSVLQYQQIHVVKVVKGKEADVKLDKVVVPENLTCHFSFGIETMR